MDQPSISFLKRRLKFWRPILGLKRWKISMSYGDLGDQIVAEVEPLKKKKTAHITFNNNPEFQNALKYYYDSILLHELFHIFFANRRLEKSVTDNTTFSNIEEYICEIIMLRKFQCEVCKKIHEIFYLWSDLEKDLKEEKDTWGYILYYCSTCDASRKLYLGVEAPTITGCQGQYMSMENWWKKHPEEYKRKTEEILADKARKNEIIKKRLNKQPLPNDDKRKERHRGYGKGQKENKLKID
jgi:hypothetical protein